MVAKPLTPIFDELQQTAIENGYWGRAELDGVKISASFSPYNGTTMKFHDTAGGLSFQFSGIDGDQIEQVARIVAAGMRAENPIDRSAHADQAASCERHDKPGTRQRICAPD